MKERPILFSGAMVRALLAGTKTQTRRVMKAVKHPDFGNLYEPSCMAREAQNAIERACPYGQPGDRLWIRETFQPIFAEGIEDPYGADWKTGKGYATSYPATDGVQEFIDEDDNLSDRCWSSIHMPRWASRITLEVTDVRVERLQDISYMDAKAEGIEGQTPTGPWKNYQHDGYWFPEGETSAPVLSFASLWESINGSASWAANPWVWAVEFRKVNP